MGVTFYEITGSDGTVVLRDPWVLLLLVVIWTFVAVKFYFDSKRLRSVAGIIRRPARPSVFAPSDDEEPALQEREVKKENDFFFEPCPAGRHKHTAGGPVCQGFREPRARRLRSWENFRSPTARAPPEPQSNGITFQRQFSTVSRLFIYASMQKGAMRRCTNFMVVNCALAVTTSYLLRTSEAFSEATGTSFFSQSAVLGNLLAAYEVQKVLLPLASFVLALFINLKLAWYQGIITQSWSIQGGLNNIALVVGSVTGGDANDAALRAKYRLYRYLNLVHFLVYWRIDDNYEDVTLRDLVSVHLITARERQLLCKSPVPRNAVLLWIGDIFQELAALRLISEPLHSSLFESLAGLRASIDGLVKELTRVYPISYVQLVQLMIDVAMLLAAPSLTYTVGGTQTGRDSYMLYLWPAFGSILLALFYQGGMRLITVLEDPFGSDFDDLDADWLLLSSERAIFGYLKDRAPRESPLGSDTDDSSHSPHATRMVGSPSATATPADLGHEAKVAPHPFMMA